MMCASTQLVLDHVSKSILIIANHKLTYAHSASQLVFAHLKYSPVVCPAHNMQGVCYHDRNSYYLFFV